MQFEFKYVVFSCGASVSLIPAPCEWAKRIRCRSLAGSSLCNEKKQWWVGAISSAPTVGGAITSVSLVGGGREELRGAWQIPRGGGSSSLAYRTVHWRKLKPANHELSLAAPCGLSKKCVSE